MFYSQFSSWINVLLLSFYLVGKSTALKCYICGEDDLSACTDFQVSDERYSKECEGRSTRCRIARKSSGMILSRSCEISTLDYCDVVDSIEYCYCFENLCNNLSPTEAREKRELDDMEDDIFQDSMEGSGIEKVEHKKTSLETEFFFKSSAAHSSNFIILRSNLYLSASVLSCLIITKCQ